MVVNLYHPYTQFPRNVLLSHRDIVTLIIAPYKYSYSLTYLLMSFLLINVYGSSAEKHVQTKIFIRRLRVL